MSSRSKGKRKSKSDSIAKSKQRRAEEIESVQSAEDTTIDIDAKFLETIIFLHKANDTIQRNISNKKINKNIKVIKTSMDKLFHEVIISKDIKFDNIVGFAQAHLSMSTTVCPYEDLYEATAKELNLSEDYLIKCLVLLGGDKLNCKAILMAITALNKLGSIRLVFGDDKKCKLFLCKARQLYSKYTKKMDEYPVPIDIAINIGLQPRENTKLLLEHQYKLTLEKLVEVYSEIFIDEPTEKYMIYMHKMLQQKRKYMKEFNEDNIIWAEEAGNLSKCLVKNGRFTESRNHLAAAIFVLNEYFEEKYIKTNKIYIFARDNNDYNEAILNNTMYWAEYGIELLRVSKDRLLWGKVCKCHENANNSKSSTKSGKRTKKLLLFSGIEKELDIYIRMITDDYLLDYKSAKAVFIKVLEWLNNAKIQYEKRTSPYAIIDTAEFISKAYKYLACYEQCKENQKKLHKLRIQILEDTNNKVVAYNIANSMNASLSLNFWIEVADAYSTLLDETIEDLQLTTVLSAEWEINYLAKSIVKHFQICLDVNKTQLTHNQ